MFLVLVFNIYLHHLPNILAPTATKVKLMKETCHHLRMLMTLNQHLTQYDGHL